MTRSRQALIVGPRFHGHDIEGVRRWPTSRWSAPSGADEGKGKIVDWLSSRADVVVRFQGGHNAGHTLVGRKPGLQAGALLPSGVVQGKLSVIGNGVVVDPWHLLDEIARIEAQGVVITPEILVLADNAALILPLHRDLDQAREKEAIGGKIGTTGRGIGPGL